MDEPRPRIALASLTPDERDALLASAVSAVLACNGLDGYPRMLPCWFLWAEGAFHTTSIAGKYHVRALRADPRASFCVETAEQVERTRRRHRQVKATGDVEVIEDPAGDWFRRIREKYLGPTAPLPADDAGPRLVLRLRPHRLRAHGGTIELKPGAAAARTG